MGNMMQNNMNGMMNMMNFNNQNIPMNQMVQMMGNMNAQMANNFSNQGNFQNNNDPSQNNNGGISIRFRKNGGGKNEETQFIQILIYIVPRIKVPAQCNKCKTLQKITEKQKKITSGARAVWTMRISPDRIAVTLSGARHRPLRVIFDRIIAEKEGKDKGRGEGDSLRHIHCMIQKESRQPTGTV